MTNKQTKKIKVLTENSHSRAGIKHSVKSNEYYELKDTYSRGGVVHY